MPQECRYPKLNLIIGILHQGDGQNSVFSIISNLSLSLSQAHTHMHTPQKIMASSGIIPLLDTAFLCLSSTPQKRPSPPTRTRPSRPSSLCPPKPQKTKPPTHTLVWSYMTEVSVAQRRPPTVFPLRSGLWDVSAAPLRSRVSV